MLATHSKGILKIPFLASLLGAPLVRLGWFGAGLVEGVVGWGLRPSAARSREFAQRHGLPFIALEDGFLRSFGTGATHPPLSIVVDHTGIYYDATQHSDLENLLNSDKSMLDGRESAVASAKALILKHGLSKYNHAPDMQEADFRHTTDRKRILIVDQTAGDMSVKYGLADEATFSQMLQCARLENPGAIIYVKTHPEVSSGHKRGYLSNVQEDENTQVIREAVNPLDLIQSMDHIYVVSSTMGFEGLLAGKKVSVFGMPWYAGWGVSDDRQVCVRRTKKRSVDELFAAAYFDYARYISPLTHQKGSIFEVLDWLILQKNMSKRYQGRMICVGFRRWKAANLKPMLHLLAGRVIFVKNTHAAKALIQKTLITQSLTQSQAQSQSQSQLQSLAKSQINKISELSELTDLKNNNLKNHYLKNDDCLIHWGRDAPSDLVSLAANNMRLLRMEDGFVRSVGLGSDLIAPQSFVLDECGIYFDPTCASDLENILNTAHFNTDDLTRAKYVHIKILNHGITKYNIESQALPQWLNNGKIVVLVVGQVEDDASIIYGCEDVRTNLGLLQAARAQNPHAFIVYKPHPDVMARNRVGHIAQSVALEWADYIETDISIVSCIETCSVLYTMTSLSGFDALLRGKRVVVYGRPFYAGWGLTIDKLPFMRRDKSLNLHELIAGALLQYPLYWDAQLKGYTTCEAVLERLVEERDYLELRLDSKRISTITSTITSTRALTRTSKYGRMGYLHRQFKKLKILGSAFLKR